ncbi:MAG: HAMP domain-containing sensor histidine kinase [Gemmatimonadota bacterium]
MRPSSEAPGASRFRTRLFPTLFALAAIPAAGLAAWFYVMSVGAVEGVLQRQTTEAVSSATAHIRDLYPQLLSETSLPARAGEVVTWYAARGSSAAADAQAWEEEMRPFLEWFLEAGSGRFERVVFLDADGAPLVQHPPFASGGAFGQDSVGGSPTDSRGLPAAGAAVQVTVQRDTPTGTVVRFARPVRAVGAQPSPGFVYVDAPLASLLPQVRRGDVELALADRASDTWLVAPWALRGRIPLSFEPLVATLSASPDTAHASRFSSGDLEYMATLVHLAEPAWSAVAILRADPYLAAPRRTGAVTVGATLAFVLVAGGLIFGLVRRVQVRTTALELAHARVEEETRNKSEFLSRMSHDLRTPMNAIIGYTRILLRRLKGVIEDRQFRNLQNIQTSADNLLKLINEILDLSRIEAGRIDLKLEPVDLGRLVAECVAAVEPLVQPGVELVQELEPLPTVTTDAGRVRQVVMNLLGNAVKFTEAGKVTVSLRIADRGCELSVADTGVGIPAEDLSHIFEEFRQVERQVGEKTEGTGLGLAIAKKCVEMLGGTISAESEVGEGSTFIVRIGDYSGSTA